MRVDIPDTIYIRNGWTYEAADLPNGAFTLRFAELPSGVPPALYEITGTVVGNAITLVLPATALTSALSGYVNRDCFVHRIGASDFHRVTRVLIGDARPD
jgi:hypothetical protein